MDQFELKEYLDYCEITGVFTRKKSISNCCKVGDVAGTKNNASGYRLVSVNGKQYYEHRMAILYFYGVMPVQVDHINGIRDDNRIVNLRDVSESENHKNVSPRSGTSSGCQGVSWIKKDKKWRSYIQHNGKQVLLGRFKDKDEAIKARIAGQEKYGYHKNHGSKS